MSRPIKIPLHGLLLQISFYTPVYNYTTVFFFFLSRSFLATFSPSIKKKSAFFESADIIDRSQHLSAKIGRDILPE